MTSLHIVGDETFGASIQISLNNVQHVIKVQSNDDPVDICYQFANEHGLHEEDLILRLQLAITQCILGASRAEATYYKMNAVSKPHITPLKVHGSKPTLTIDSISSFNSNILDEEPSFNKFEEESKVEIEQDLVYVKNRGWVRKMTQNNEHSEEEVDKSDILLHESIEEEEYYNNIQELASPRRNNDPVTFNYF